MENEQGQESSNTSVEPEASTATPPAPAPQQQPQPKPQPPAGNEGGGDDLPTWALKQRKELREEAANYRTQLREEQAKWEGGATSAEVAELQKRIRELEARDIAHTTGLPIEFTDRLKGDTAAEMKADAEKLLESIGGGARPLSGGLDPADTPSDSKSDIAARVERMRARRF